jgi:hypothetical protein
MPSLNIKHVWLNAGSSVNHEILNFATKLRFSCHIEAKKTDPVFFEKNSKLSECVGLGYRLLNDALEKMSSPQSKTNGMRFKGERKQLISSRFLKKEANRSLFEKK